MSTEIINLSPKEKIDIHNKYYRTNGYIVNPGGWITIKSECGPRSWLKLCTSNKLLVEKVLSMISEKCGALPEISSPQAITAIDALLRLKYLLIKGFISGEIFKQVSELLWQFINVISKSDSYFKEMEVRTNVPTQIESYVAVYALRAITETLFDEHSDQLAFLSSMSAEHAQISFYACVAMAYMELDTGQVKNAELLADAAYSKKSSEVILSDLFYKIKSEAIRNEEVCNLDVQTDDMSEYFCSLPFEMLCVSQFNHELKLTTFKTCNCPAWLSVGSQATDLDYNCKEFVAIRKSVLDGSYKYCSRIFCPYIRNKTLPKKEAINDLYLRDIIDNKKVVVEQIRVIHLEYDRDCNLKCPQCRKDFYHSTSDQISDFNAMIDKNILPIISKVKKMTLSGAGEALSSSHSLYLLKQLSLKVAPELKIQIMTNGAAVSYDKWVSLGEAADLIRSVVVSIDGTREIYEECRYPAKWESLCKSMELFKKLRENGKLSRISITTVVQTKNYTTFDELYTFALAWKVDNISFKRMRNMTGIAIEDFVKIDICSIDNPENRKFCGVMSNLKMRAVEMRRTQANATNVSFADFVIMNQANIQA